MDSINNIDIKIRPYADFLKSGLILGFCAVLGFFITANRIDAQPRYILFIVTTFIALFKIIIGKLYSICVTENHLIVKLASWKKVASINEILEIKVKTLYSHLYIPIYYVVVTTPNDVIKMLSTSEFLQIEGTLLQYGVETKYENIDVEQGKNNAFSHSTSMILTVRLQMAKKVIPVTCFISILISMSSFIMNFDIACWAITVNGIIIYILCFSFHDIFSTCGIGADLATTPKSVWTLLDIKKDVKIILILVITLIVFLSAMVFRIKDTVSFTETEIFDDLYFWSLLIITAYPLRVFREDCMITDYMQLFIITLLMLFLFPYTNCVRWTISDYESVVGEVYYSEIGEPQKVMLIYNGECEEYNLAEFEKERIANQNQVTIDVHKDVFGEVQAHLGD